MEKGEDQTPLQEVIYKPTTQKNSLTALKSESKSTSSFLYFSASIADLIIFTCGICFAWSSPVLPQLAGTNDTDINPIGRQITHSEESWIAGILCLGAALGPLLACTAADKIGRKNTLLLAACPIALSLVVIAYAKTVILYYICRLTMGIGTGAVFTVLPMYLAEISEDHNRGTIGCSLGAFLSCGVLFSFLVGPFVSIRNFCLLCAIPLLISIPVFLIWIPETPHFLAAVNKNDLLEKSLTKLRCKSAEEIRVEVSEITNAVLEETKNKGSLSDIFKLKGLRKGLIITLGLVILQQFAGINVVLAYMQNIFDAAGSGLSPAVSTIIIGAIQFLTTVLTSFLVDRLGRRILLLASAFGSCVSMIALGLYFYLKTNDFQVNTISWLPVSSLIVFIITFNLGLGPLPWAVMAELFPPNVRSIAATLTTITCFSGGFLITIFFPSLALVLGMAKSFWIFALVSLIGTVFVYFVLPETKGKSLQEIQRILEGRKT